MPPIPRYFHSDDGLRLHVADWLAPRADAPVLLCLPGLTRNGRDFARLAQRAQAAGWRVLCPDQRGRGLSERDPDPRRYRPDRYVADMLTLLDQLGVAQVSIVGTSLGGMMGTMLAAMQPGRVQRLVLNDVGPVLEAQGLARIAGYVGQQPPADSLDDAIARTARTQATVFPDFDPADWCQMVADTHRVEDGQWWPDYDPAIAQGLANGSATPPLWPLFDAARDLPMLLLRGALSDLLSADTVAAMRDRLPQLQAVEVPQRGHAPTLNEAQARAALDAFLLAP
ncbi:MAG: alpha/beta hydrolase [Inhella sp.]|jgi:pimeloyl-ACP methyl ester carboxylesterase|uniref:alpha/beta fold hydrolase n=1 Tax=Inhella sp. TaxID=1921806 RepID=UPI0022BB7AA3|nr:alpha/beta hydrolase [Inhella sp.]MCZ8235022.1 alpha/beta hydrolase [Inhella sp.]